MYLTTTPNHLVRSGELMWREREIKIDRGRERERKREISPLSLLLFFLHKFFHFFLFISKNFQENPRRPKNKYKFNFQIKLYS